MTTGSWWDTAAITVIGLVCLGLILRRIVSAFGAAPGGGCGSCAKSCHGGGQHQPPERPTS
jgi:hypothetical protein